MAKKKPTLETVEASLARWRTRLKRAVTMIDKLERQRKRIEQRGLGAECAAVATGSHRAPVPLEVPPLPMTSPTATIPSPNVPAKPTEIDTDIPAFLRRQDNTSPVADQIRQEQADHKKAKARGRIDRMKAKQRGDLKKMPLTGKAALAAIRG